MGDNNNRNTPVEFKIESPIKQIICGAYHTFAICENNKIYCWGFNGDEQLGLGDNKERNEPVEFKIERNSSPIKQIICGESHTIVISENKKIYYYGLLGDNKFVESLDNTKQWEFFGEKMNRLEWKEIKFLWIAFCKENKKTCPLATLPKDMIKYISIQETK